MTRTIANKQPGVALFPFLAVLICTMGVLILLLVIAMRSSSVAAETMATDAAQSLRAQAEREAELTQAREAAEFAREGLTKSRDKTAEQLRDEQLKLAHLEEHSRRLEDRLRQLQTESRAIDAVQTTRLVDRNAAAIELGRLQAAVAEAKAQLDAAKIAAKPKERFYAIVPYDGPNGTRRRPVYIECLADRIVLQPEGVVLTDNDFRPPLDPGNPLASALRATREHLQRIGQLGPDGEPYPLLIVRPGGSETYASARSAMKNWDAEFGYELVDADMKLAYPLADSVLAATQERAIADARRRRELQAAAAPARYGRGGGVTGYRASPSGGMEAIGEEEGTSHGRWGNPGAAKPSPTGRIAGDGQTPLGDNKPSDKLPGAPKPGGQAGQAGQPLSPGEKTDQYRPGQMPNRRPQEGTGGSGEPVQSIAATKGENWGLPQASPRSTGFRRPIVAICEPTRIVLIPEAGDTTGGAVVPFSGTTQDAALQLVPVIHKRIDRWGLAGVKAYWKPVLQTRVLPGGEARYAELEVLLDGSGIELSKMQ